MKVAQEAKHLDFEAWLPIVTPSFIWNWLFQQFIIAEIKNVITGRIDRLLLSVPPRHGKSELVTVRLPAWVLERTPGFRWIIGAYSQTLANKFSRKTRRICDQRGVPLNSQRRAVDDWETTTDPTPGGLRAAGVGGGVTGMGGDGIIIDDPVKNREEANSQTYRDKTWDWYTDDLYTRLEPGGFIVVIMTRWHEDDLAGRLVREEGVASDGGQWTNINLPAIAEDDDPIGRLPGQALCPERYNEKALARLQGVLRSSFFALFQGRPVAAEGNMIKREWFRYYGEPPAPHHRVAVVQSWDTASKATELSAYSVCTTWYITRLGVYLVDVFRDHLEYPALKRAVKNKAERFKPSAILIEDKSTGQSLLQDLRGEISASLIAIEPEGDKVTRLSTESAAYESGQVYHPENAPWLEDYESELTSFPLAATADQVDSTSQFLRWARKRSWTFSWDSAGLRDTMDALGEGRGDISNHGTIGGGNDFAGF